jgi:hypothetical protein
MSPPLLDDGEVSPVVPTLIGTVLALSVMAAVLIRLGADPEEVGAIAMQITLLVIGYIASASRPDPELRA